LAYEGTLTEKMVGTEHHKDSFLACGRDHGNLNLAGLNEKNRVRSIALSKDPFAFRQGQHPLAIQYVFKELRDMWIWTTGICS